CFRSYGRDAVGASKGEGTEIIVDRCRLTGDRAGDCLYGAAGTIADANGAAGPAASSCKRAPRADEGPCFAGVGVVVGLLNATNTKRDAACARLAGAYVDECVRAGRAEVAVNGRGAWG